MVVNHLGQCLKHGGITTHLGSDKQKVGSDKQKVGSDKSGTSWWVTKLLSEVALSTEYLLTSECVVII